MSKRGIVVAIGVFAVGIVLGVLGGVYVVDDDSGATATTTTVAPEVCAEARATVDAAADTIEQLSDESEVQDATFLTAILVEQRTMTFAMDFAPTCFTLQERASAEGLIDGLSVLLTPGVLPTGSLPSPSPVTTDVTPPDSEEPTGE
jgi:hypothetical protein